MSTAKERLHAKLAEKRIERTSGTSGCKDENPIYALQPPQERIKKFRQQEEFGLKKRIKP